uniref:Uncharacterized protein n=1 Tax=Caenorhabditis japonica TaxID=281687 RepID=A0A8R1I7E5_CAEJA
MSLRSPFCSFSVREQERGRDFMKELSSMKLLISEGRMHEIEPQLLDISSNIKKVEKEDMDVPVCQSKPFLRISRNDTELINANEESGSENAEQNLRKLPAAVDCDEPENDSGVQITESKMKTPTAPRTTSLCSLTTLHYTSTDPQIEQTSRLLRRSSLSITRLNNLMEMPSRIEEVEKIPFRSTPKISKNNVEIANYNSKAFSRISTNDTEVILENPNQEWKNSAINSSLNHSAIVTEKATEQEILANNHVKIEVPKLIGSHPPEKFGVELGPEGEYAHAENEQSLTRQWKTVTEWSETLYSTVPEQENALNAEPISIPSKIEELEECSIHFDDNFGNYAAEEADDEKSNQIEMEEIEAENDITMTESIQESSLRNDCGNKKKNNSNSIQIRCYHRGCRFYYMWKPIYGKLRLLDHILAHHSTEKHFKCYVCEFKGHSSRAIKYHFFIKHPDVKMKGCGIRDIQLSMEVQSLWMMCFSPHIDVIGTLKANDLNKPQRRKHK